jgi:integration host factor subunit alpha
MQNFVDFLEQPTLTKAELVAELRQKMGISQREAREMVDAFFQTITETLASGQDVKIACFGNFELRHKAARPGRNVRTGETVIIEQRSTVKFFASLKNKERLQAAVMDDMQRNRTRPLHQGLLDLVPEPPRKPTRQRTRSRKTTTPAAAQPAA